MKQGELAMGWVPPFKDHPTTEGYLQWATEDPANRYSGTVFTNTFIDFAKRRVTTTYSVDKFYEELKQELKKYYTETKYMVIESGLDPEAFMRQPPQTLTRFDSRGVALP